MNKAKSILMASTLLLAVGLAFNQESKAATGMQKAGEAITWAPKKIWHGLAWCGDKVKAGAKKVTGKS